MGGEHVQVLLGEVLAVLKVVGASLLVALLKSLSDGLESLQSNELLSCVRLLGLSHLLVVAVVDVVERDELGSLVFWVSCCLGKSRMEVGQGVSDVQRGDKDGIRKNTRTHRPRHHHKLSESFFHSLVTHTTPCVSISLPPRLMVCQDTKTRHKEPLSQDSPAEIHSESSFSPSCISGSLYHSGVS